MCFVYVSIMPSTKVINAYVPSPAHLIVVYYSYAFTSLVLHRRWWTPRLLDGARHSGGGECSAVNSGRSTILHACQSSPQINITSDIDEDFNINASDQPRLVHAHIYSMARDTDTVVEVSVWQ